MASADPPATGLPAALPISTFAPGEGWRRIHRTADRPVFFGPRSGQPPIHRFDAPGGEYRVLYLGRSLEAAFVETLLRNPAIPVVERRAVELRSASVLTSLRTLRLVDLTGAGLSRIGADARIAAGPYAVSGRWALALWRHSDAPDGLLYRSRHNPDHLCAAVFDRPDARFETASSERLIDVPHRWAPILAAHGKGLV